MRIIAGELKGRNFDSPHSHKTHPMSEKMRGALFNVLGDITGLTVFDAYGGSGALAFEALSRGATEALITEVDKNAAEVIKQNIAVLGLAEKATLVRTNSATYSKNYPYKKFDLVICDPPYDQVQPIQIIQLAKNVKDAGLLIISKPTGSADFDFDELELQLKRAYGDGTLVFYRKI
jgi:16S rRNA (guanine966-N2)-methyltransferase